MYFFLLKREKQPLGVHGSVKMFQYLPLLSCGKTMQKLVYKRFNKLAHFSATMALTNILSVADDTSSKLAVF